MLSTVVLFFWQVQQRSVISLMTIIRGASCCHILQKVVYWTSWMELQIARYPFSIMTKVAVSGHPACNLKLSQEAPIPAYQQKNAEIKQHTLLIVD